MGKFVWVVKQYQTIDECFPECWGEPVGCYDTEEKGQKECDCLQKEYGDNQDDILKRNHFYEVERMEVK